MSEPTAHAMQAAQEDQKHWLWIKKRLGLPEDADWQTVYGKMHNVCANDHGYTTYIEAFKCDDKQGEIARLTVRAQGLEARVRELEEELKAVRRERLDYDDL